MVKVAIKTLRYIKSNEFITELGRKHQSFSQNKKYVVEDDLATILFDLEIVEQNVGGENYIFKGDGSTGSLITIIPFEVSETLDLRDFLSVGKRYSVNSSNGEPNFSIDNFSLANARKIGRNGQSIDIPTTGTSTFLRTTSPSEAWIPTIFSIGEDGRLRLLIYYQLDTLSSNVEQYFSFVFNTGAPIQIINNVASPRNLIFTEI